MIDSPPAEARQLTDPLQPRYVARDIFRDFCGYKHRVMLNNWDWWTIYSGDPRVGKSSSSLWDAAFTSHDDFMKYWKERICYDPEDLLGQFQVAPKGATIILDEGGEAWLNRDFATLTNKVLAKAAQMVGEYNLNVIINVPNIWFLDSPAIYRHRTWGCISAPNFQRGHAEFLKPRFKKYGKQPIPFWDLKLEHRFPALPKRVYDDYEKFKHKEGTERLARYVSVIKKESGRGDNPQIVLKKMKMQKDQEKFKGERGKYAWRQIMYHFRTNENCARTVAEVMNAESRKGVVVKEE